MSEPIIVTKEAIKEWVMKQPDDRKVLMTNSYYNEGECGCLMVQYGKDVLKQEFRNVGFTSWWSGELVSKTPSIEIATFDPSVGGIIKLLGNPTENYCDWADAENFGDLKKQLSR